MMSFGKELVGCQSLYVEPAYADAFETLFRERARLIDNMEVSSGLSHLSMFS